MVKSLYCFLSFCWIHYYVGGGARATLRGPPKILSDDLKPLQVVQVGQEFKASCPVEGSGLIVDWYKDEEKITPAWSHIRTNNKSLRIKQIMFSDSGIYKCKGVNGFGSQIIRMRLIVIDNEVVKRDESILRKELNFTSKSSFNTLPMFTQESLRQAGPTHLSSGNTIYFQCEAHGIPTPRVTWLKDGIPIIGDSIWKLSNWTLILTKLENEDDGTYTCIAENSLEKVEFSIILRVAEMIEKNKPVLAPGFPSNTTVLSGNKAILECIVHEGISTIPPSIKWLKRVPKDQVESQQPLRYKHRFFPIDNKQSLILFKNETLNEEIQINESHINGSFVSKLIFLSVKPSDEGSYICLAANHVGFTNKEVYLRVLAGSEIVNNAENIIPIPIVVIGASIIVALIAMGAACMTRRHQESQRKQTKSISPRKLSNNNSPSINSSSFKKSGGGYEQQLLVATSTHSSSSSSGNMQTCTSKLVEPTIEIAMSHCSCCGDHSEDRASSVRPYEQCFNSSFLVPSNHSFHYGHWT